MTEAIEIICNDIHNLFSDDIINIITNKCEDYKNNKLESHDTRNQEFYDRYCGGWELEYYLSSIYDICGNKITTVPDGFQEMFV